MANLDLESAVTRYAQHSRAPGTRASYLQKMVPFRAFCAERGVKAVPADPETVRLYLAKLAEDGLSVSTVNQFLSATGEAHEAAGHLSPRFESVDELAEWAAKNASTFAHFTATAAEWKQMLSDGLVHHREGNAIFI